MKILPNIELSDQELDLIIENNMFNYGGEAIICKNNNPHTLYKIFTQYGTDIPECMSENKLKKLSWLFQHPIENIVNPIATITNQGSLIGYEMTFDKDDESLLDAILNRNEKKHFLEKTKDILQSFSHHGITFGDVKDDNVLVNTKTGTAKFCDIDNIKIESLPIDVMGQALTEYYELIGVIDEKTDAYMHNLLVLEQLKYNNLSHEEILHILTKCPLTTEFPEEAKRIIETLIKPTTFSGEYIIQYIKNK